MYEVNPFTRIMDGWDERHWIKYQSTDGKGGFCLMGRMFMTSGNHTRLAETQMMVQDMLEANYGVRAIPIWNDAEATTWDDVVAVLEKCEAKWAETHG